MSGELSFESSWRRHPHSEVYRSDVSRELLSHGGRKIKAILDPIVMRAEDHEALARAGRTLLEIQRTLLKRHFRPHMKVRELLAAFQVPLELASAMSWDGLTTHVPPVARHDVLLSTDGSFKICELNVDSSVGGGETHELARIYLRHFGGRVAPVVRTRLLEGPYVALARFLRAECQAHGRTRIVLLDWSSWAVQGFFSAQLLKNTLAAELPGIDVVARDEIEYACELKFANVAALDLVYRLFPGEDALADVGFLRELTESGARIISGFESEIYSSKLWLALFHDPSLREALTGNERACIDQYVPFTEVVHALNLERLLARKDELVWKTIGSFGGKGILFGNKASVVEIRDAIVTAPTGSWIAQQYVRTQRLSWHDDERGATRELSAVLGIYEINGRAVGALVRADDASEVVNVSNGASLGWALPLFESETKEIT